MHTLSIFKNDDPVAVSDSTQPMGDEECGSPFQARREGITDKMVVERIKCTGRLVKDQVLRII